MASIPRDLSEAVCIDLTQETELEPVIGGVPDLGEYPPIGAPVERVAVDEVR